MALLTRDRSRQADTSIDLLPQEIRSEQKTKRLFRIAAAVSIVILLVLAIITVALRMQISSQEQILREEQAKAASLRTQVGSLAEYETLEASLNASRALLATALVGDVSVTRFLDDLDQNMPGDSSLQSISVTIGAGSTPQGEPSLGTVQYQASVRSFPGLANWLDTMDAIEGLRFVYLSNGSRSDAGVGFSATAHLTEAMLSGRCTQEGTPCP